MSTRNSCLISMIILFNLAVSVLSLVEFSKSFADVKTIKIASEQGVTLEACKAGCDRRRPCKSIVYSRRTSYCVFVANDRSLHPVFPSPGTVLVSGFHPQSMVTSSNNSSVTCNDNATSSFDIQACPELVVEQGTVRGNMQQVGARRRLDCLDPTGSTNTTTTYPVCQVNGDWSDLMACTSGNQSDNLTSTTVPTSDQSTASTASTSALTTSKTSSSVTTSSTSNTPLTSVDTSSSLTTVSATTTPLATTPASTTTPAPTYTTSMLTTLPLTKTSTTTESSTGRPETTTIQLTNTPVMTQTSATTMLTTSSTTTSTTSSQDCSDPLPKTATTLDTGSTLLGTVRTYTCWNLYITQTGSNTISITCEASGQWSTTSLACLRDCGTPPAVSHASVNNGDTYEGSMRQYTCDSRYQVKAGGVVSIATTVDVTCGSDGSWEVGFECVISCASTGPLVSGPNGIANSKITASSEYDNDYRAYNGRLNNSLAWAVADRANNMNSYIQFDFTTTRIITSITTQGLISITTQWSSQVSLPEYVTSYHVLYSSTCVSGSFVTVKDALGSTKTFTGNSDTDGHVTNTFAAPVLARCVRVNARTWNNWITLRVELYGC